MDGLGDAGERRYGFSASYFLSIFSGVRHWYRSWVLIFERHEDLILICSETDEFESMVIPNTRLP